MGTLRVAADDAIAVAQTLRFIQKKIRVRSGGPVAHLVFKPGFEERDFAPVLEGLHIGNDIGDILGG